jgi:hypothetical protein
MLSKACLIFGSITIFAVISWFVIPEEKWLRKQFLINAKAATGNEEAMNSTIAVQDEAASQMNNKDSDSK